MKGRAAKNPARCQTREISWVDETFTVLQRSRAVAIVAERAHEMGTPDARDMTVVDAGCYDGRLYWYMEQNHLFPRYLGLDVREDYVSVAATKISSGRARFGIIDLERESVGTHYAWGGVPDEYAQGDVVVCLEVLEHTKLPYTALENLFQLAKPGGLVVVGMPVNTRARTFHKVDREQNLGHVGFLVHEDLLDVVNSWGHDLYEQSPGWSLKSSYRIPSDLDEPWATMRKRLGPAFRPIYLACMDEPNGGGFYVWRKKGTDEKDEEAWRDMERNAGRS